MIGRDLLGIEDLDRADIERILETAEHMGEIGEREVKKVPTLRGRTLVNLFFEGSTRTQTSFEIAGKRLSADVVNFSAMSSSLAMPGPVAAAHMSSLAHAKDTIRATILVMFVFSYTAAFAIQAVFAGVPREALTLAATLTPATLIGILLGRMSVSWISESGFRKMISIVLVATSISLLVASFMGLFADA